MITIKLTGGNYRNYLLGSMQSGQEVGIQISAFTNGGEGPRSRLIQGRTSKNDKDITSKWHYVVKGVAICIEFVPPLPPKKIPRFYYCSTNHHDE